jgi:formamidopyrimidine-DNA glycosylase
MRRLHRAIRAVLRQGIANRAPASATTSERTTARRRAELAVYQRTGQPCLRRPPISRIVVGQRSTHFCPNCQVLPGEVEAG